MSDARLDRLERHVDHIDQTLVDIKVTLATLPTKRDLTNNVFAGLGIGLALMALIIGGIIGGLSWIRPDPTPPPVVQASPPLPPIIIQVPAQTAPPSPEPAPKP